MARKIVHQLIDDLDGTVLEVGVGSTVRFSLEGAAYEIDLTDGNAAALRDALAPYIAAARSVSSRGPARGTTRTQRRSGQRDYGPVRAWAADNGYTLSGRGRIPASVLDAYDAAH